jgi:AcrR family transcriptional regulator
MNELGKSTPHSRRIAWRRAEILTAAGQLFAEKGYHRTTTLDIAAAAEVSEGTIYNYFSNKEELLFAIMEQISQSQDSGDRYLESLPDDPKEFFLAILDSRQEFLQKNRIMLQAILSEILVNPELRNRYYQELIFPEIESMRIHLQERMNRGQICVSDASLVARILMAIFSGLFLLQVSGDEVVSTQWQDLTRQMTVMFFEGVRVNPE